MTNLTPTFVQAAVLEALRSPSTTVEQLQAVMNSEIGASFSEMTMGEFLAGAEASEAPKPKAPRARKAPSNGEIAEVSTRTQADREAYDASVLAFVQKSKEPVGSTTIREACGGTPLQARKALNRLIETGEITWEGKARATKYFVA